MAAGLPVEREPLGNRNGRGARSNRSSSRRTERLARLALRSNASADPAYDTLRDRYRALTQKYKQAVERGRQVTEKYAGAVRALQQHAAEGSSLRMLAVWALRKSSSGFALVQGERISLTNVAFVTLDRPATAEERWERVASEEPASEDQIDSYPHLRALALGEAKRRAGSNGAPYRVQFARGVQVVSVSVEGAGHLGRPFSIVIVRDETDLAAARAAAVALEEKFVQQERVRTVGGLAMGIVHDLNNVLGSLAMRFDLLQRDAVYRVTQSRNIEVMNQIIHSCTARVRTLHTLVRAPDPTPAEVDLAEVVASAVEIIESGFLHGSTSATAIRVDIDLPDLPRVQGSADELRHVFINLLVNARDAMDKGGTIKVRGSVSGASVRVFFEDEGPGIPPEHLEQIFEPFFTTKGANGTGVGLAIAREALAKFGGSISAENVASGGARFELRFSPAR